jgi:ABC-2 type transport system ATP-binding protein
VTPPPSELALATAGLTRHFGTFTAVDGIDLAVPRGSFYGFLGPNGAGKSTTIKCLTGLLEPSAGTVRILGLDPAKERRAVQRQVGVVPEDLALFAQLTAAETVRFVGQVHGLAPEEIETRSQELFRLLGLDKAGDAVAADYSHGMRKKLALVVALLTGPRLLFLDEPFEGIDAVASRLVRQVLTSYVAAGGTIFLTSHILETVERLCDHVGILDQGKLVAQGPLETLQRGRAGQSLEELFLGVIQTETMDAPELPWLRR